MSLQVVDTLITGAIIITLDAERRIYRDGALAVAGDRIAAVGPRADVEARCRAKEIIDGRRFVITPGFINGHIHVTGDPLTRAFMPDDLEGDPGEKLQQWVIPRYFAHGPEDEALSAQLAAVQMLRTGTTCFLEAGTIRYLDEVVESLSGTGIRGRVGVWVEGRAQDDSSSQDALTAQAIQQLEDEVARFPARRGETIAAWPLLVGHNTNPDDVWRAAKTLADTHGLGISAHMSPYPSDPDWYLQVHGKRPIEHLEALGVLGHNVVLTHAAHVDPREVEILAATGTHVALCPFAALKGAFGITAAGRFPEMAAAGVNLILGTDGYDSDILRLAPLVSGLYKDARQDITLFPAHDVLAMLTLNGARAMGLEAEIGSLEEGKKADFVCHDTDRPEWRPVLHPVNQLVWTVDGRGVHSVWVNGVRVVEAYRSTLVDEEALYARAQKAGERIIKRTGLPMVCPWPVVS